MKIRFTTNPEAALESVRCEARSDSPRADRVARVPLQPPHPGVSACLIMRSDQTLVPHVITIIFRAFLKYFFTIRYAMFL